MNFVVPKRLLDIIQISRFDDANNVKAAQNLNGSAETLVCAILSPTLHEYWCRQECLHYRRPQNASSVSCLFHYNIVTEKLRTFVLNGTVETKKCRFPVKGNGIVTFIFNMNIKILCTSLYYLMFTLYTYSVNHDTKAGKSGTLYF
jgi:hypothetical protein